MNVDTTVALVAPPAGTHIHLVDIEAAINWWRPRGGTDGVSLSAALRPLAHVYALMIHERLEVWPVERMPEPAMQAWLSWYATTPDAPCIAICSTSQGDAVCKGCGRTFEEVQHWVGMDPVSRREVWHRITAEGTAWRFQRYADRAVG